MPPWPAAATAFGDRPATAQPGVRNSLPRLRQRRRSYRPASLHETLYLCAGKHALPAALHHAALLRQRRRPVRAQVGIEIVLNFLAPDEHDRYFEIPAGRHPLRWAAALQGVGDRFAVARRRRVAECRRDHRGARRAGLDRSHRDDFRIRGRLRARLSGIADSGGMAGGACSPASPGAAKSLWPSRPRASRDPTRIR